MKHTPLLAALIVFTLTACGQKPAEKPVAAAVAPTVETLATPPVQAALPEGHPPMDAGKMANNSLPKSLQPHAGKPALTQKAQVVSVINVAQFTYLEVKQDNNTRWLAATTNSAKKGDTVQFDEGVLMTNFTSKALNRTFPSISFVSNLVVGN